MAKYNYGKKFKKNGKMVQYRYTNGRKSTKKLGSCSEATLMAISPDNPSVAADTTRPRGVYAVAHQSSVYIWLRNVLLRFERY